MILREKQIEEFANSQVDCEFFNEDLYEGIIIGAKWSDEHPDSKHTYTKQQLIDMGFTSVLQIWDDFKCWFIFSDDGMVSCRLSIYKETPQDAIVSDLYTHESIRGQGAAKAILDFCFDFAKDKECNTISLRSDNDDWVRKWYQRMGFEVESSSLWFTKKI